jgi:hypothetical protein
MGDSRHRAFLSVPTRTIDDVVTIRQSSDALPADSIPDDAADKAIGGGDHAGDSRCPIPPRHCAEAVRASDLNERVFFSMMFRPGESILS